MSGFEQHLVRRLATQRDRGLYRVLRPVTAAGGPRVRTADGDRLNFSANDYLGLARDPALVTAAEAALRQWGAGSGASRLLCGSLGLFHELEAALAELKGVPAALLFSSGYAAALGAIPALVGREDTVVLDRLAHACLIDGARLSGARLRVFRHNDAEDLERILRRERARRADGAMLVVTESVFSMDGDLAPLEAVVQVKERYGAWLLLDEAHATGLFGERFGGRAQATSLSGRIEVQMATLGKALGAAGGVICGSPALIEWLVNGARSLIYSTAPAPAAAAAALAAVRFLGASAGAERVAALWRNVDALRERLRALGRPLPTDRSPIIPLTIGDESAAMEVAARLFERGILLPAVRFPTVPRGRARLRLTVSAAHTEADLDQLADALVRVLPPPSSSDASP